MNVMRTGFLLAALTGLFLAVGYLLGGNSGMLIALAFSIATNLFAYWNGDKMVLSMHGAEQVTPEEVPELYALVDGLARRAALPMPKLYLISNPQPNAFATGRDPAHAAVAVTTGLLEHLSRDELAGVIAHELSHVKNRDTLIMTITATLAGAISMLANFASFSAAGIATALWGRSDHRYARARAPRGHAGADGRQPHPRICRRPAWRCYFRKTFVACLGPAAHCKRGTANTQ